MSAESEIPKTAFRVTTEYGKDLIRQSTFLDTIHGPSMLISSQVVNLHDKGIREALIAMGWTQPEGGKNANCEQ